MAGIVCCVYDGTNYLWTFLYSGMREYNKVSEKIRSLASSEQLLTENYLNGSETQNRYTGLVGGVLTKTIWYGFGASRDPKYLRPTKKQNTPCGVHVVER